MGCETKNLHPFEDERTTVLPILPQLEFPFPQVTTESTDPQPPVRILHPTSEPIASQAAEKNEGRTASFHQPTQESKPSLRKMKTEPGRGPRRLMTEKFALGPRGSSNRKRIQNMGYQPTALTNAAGIHHEHTLSSSSEESLADLDPPFSHLSGQYAHRNEKNDSVSYRDVDEMIWGGFSVGNDNYETKGRVSRRDGRLNISVNETNNRGYLAHALGASLRHHSTNTRNDVSHLKDLAVSPSAQDNSRRPELIAKLSALSTVVSSDNFSSQPKLNIVIMVIGSRGDIQPFLKIGKLLKESYGHRVRIATHPAFKTFVEKESELEFFSVGGDPAELMAFMVKNPGLIPSVSTVRAGEIGRKRESMFEMFQGFWRACINTTDDEHEVSNLKMMSDKHPFVADAVIANPPCFAHIHCAERLGVPLHLMFTFPYSPTQQFPHPLANIKTSNIDSNYTNFMSYPLVEMMTWQGLGDLVNRFRVKTLGLEPVSTLWAPGQLYRQKVPYTYLWSPKLIPKPNDWGPEIDIAGFVFLDLASTFRPPKILSDFLDAGEPPVYIGFGSVVVDDPDRFTFLIFEAIQKAGVRALVSKGWGGLGEKGKIPDNIYMLENTPHDWLFPKCSAVIHHGGAGTTAIGLKCGKPTAIVPFFGDQPFWGAMVAKAGAGAREAVPYKQLTSDKLADEIKQCLSSEARKAAESIAASIAQEGDGAKNAVESFLRHLPWQGEQSMRCSVLPDRIAVWTLKRSNLQLSALAAELLVERKKITWKDLRLARHCEWNDFEGPGEPITGAGGVLVNSAGGIVKTVGGMPVKWARSVKKERDDQKENDRGKSNFLVRHRRRSSKTGLKNDGSLQCTDQEKNSGESSSEEQRGLEKHLPDPCQLPSCVQNGLEADSDSPGLSKQKDLEEQNLSVSSPATSNENLAQQLIEDTGHSISKVGGAFAKVPMDLSLALAQGFHNAPRLYGDSTVRTAPRISGMHSGLRAAGSEFTFGIYDGVTGLVLQPYYGARERGTVGFVQGMGKGVGGFVLKDLAAFFGPFAYTMKGIHKELNKGKQPTAFIRDARRLQGVLDVKSLSKGLLQQDLKKIKDAWQIVNEIRKEDEVHKKEGMKGFLVVMREQRKQANSRGYVSLREAQKLLDTKQEERERRETAAVG